MHKIAFYLQLSTILLSSQDSWKNPDGEDKVILPMGNYQIDGYGRDSNHVC